VGKNDESRVQYFTANPNGEAEVVTIYLHGLAKARKKVFDYDFAELAIKGRGSQGNTVSKYRLRKIELKEKGVSTIGGRDIWYEAAIGRLNVDERGELLGSFHTEDLILVIYKSGEYELTSHELTNHYDPNNVYLIEKFNPNKVISAVHYDAKAKTHFVKRFQIETSTVGKKFQFINEGRNSTLLFASTVPNATVLLTVKDGKGEKVEEEIVLRDFIDVKGWKSTGNKLTADKFVKLKEVEVYPEEVEEANVVQTEGVDENSASHESQEVEDELTEDKPEYKETRQEKTEESKKKPHPKKDDNEKKDEGGKTFTTGDQLNLL